MAELVTLGWQLASWIETLLCHGPGDVEGDPVELDDEFLAVIARAYTLDPESARRLVRRYVLSRAKGRAKSELAGWLCCAEGLGPVRFDHWAKRGETSWWGYEYERGEPVGRTPTYPFIRILATEEGQTGNTYDVVEYVLREARIAEEVRGLDVGATRTFLPSGGEIRPCTAGAASKDGGKESFAVGDEEHLYVLPEHRQMHKTVSRNLLKRKAAEPWMLSTTTMFEPDKHSIAEEAWNYYIDLKSGKRTDPGFVFDHREGPEPKNWKSDRQLLAALKQAYGPAASWMDLQGIVEEIRRPMTDPADARRYFLNRRARRSVENWLRQWPGAWDRCAAPKLTLDDATDKAAGVDMALRHDSASVVVAGRVGDRVVVRAQIFRAPPGGRIDFVAVKAAIRHAASDGVRGVAYDPRYLELIAQELEDEGVPMVETPQSPERMVPAFGHVLELIVGQVLAHDGDEAFAAHVDAADWRETERGRVLSKRGGAPIDACYAMALACWELEQSDDGPSVYEDRPLVVLG